MSIQLKGCDISRHQGEIDFAKLKNEIDFIIIRASYGFYTIDEKAQEYINNCEKYKIPYGLYHYSYARNMSECDIEITGFINFANSQKYRPTYPLVLDMEDADKWKEQNGNPTNNTYVEICEKFLDSLEKAGYYAMLYANKDWFVNRLNDERLIRFDKWLAHWNVKAPSLKCGMWQYTSKGKLSGVSGNVDLDIAYQDYPKIITEKRLNGTKNQVNETEENNGTVHSIGDVVNFTEIYTDSYGSRLVKSAIKSGIITRIYEGRKAPYLINNGAGFLSDELINPVIGTISGHYVGETVHFDKLYTDSYGNGLVKSSIHSGTITKIYEDRKAPYLINNGAGFLSDDLII